jgi:hypothetical protein
VVAVGALNNHPARPSAAAMRPTRSAWSRTLTRLGILLTLVLPPVLHTGCVKDIAYQIRVEQEARKHVYDVKKKTLLATVREVAESDGWKVEEGDEDDGGFDLVGAPRKKNGREERLVVTLAKAEDGYRVEADLEVKQESANGGKHESVQHATFIELAVLEKLDPKAADKAKVIAKKKAKEDTKKVRACARKAVDTATEDDES